MIYPACKDKKHFQCPTQYAGLEPCRCHCHKEIGSG
jgi:hypothetical protein